jgi:hypothetical protein
MSRNEVDPKLVAKEVFWFVMLVGAGVVIGWTLHALSGR